MEDEKDEKPKPGGPGTLKHLFPPNPHPPGTVFAPPIKKEG